MAQFSSSFILNAATKFTETILAGNHAVLHGCISSVDVLLTLLMRVFYDSVFNLTLVVFLLESTSMTCSNGDNEDVACDSMSSESLRDIQQISYWLRKTASPGPFSGEGATSATGRGPRSQPPSRALNSGGGSTMDSTNSGALDLPESLNRYCDFRRDWMRVTLIKHVWFSVIC